MQANPYEPMMVDRERDLSLDDNRLGRFGFTVSLIAAIGLLAIPPSESIGAVVSSAAVCMTFLSVPGLIISAVALLYRPRRLAGWGCVVGLCVVSYLPTLIHAWFMK